MDIHIDWRDLVTTLVKLPVLWVLIAGMSFGVSCTQLVKQTYLQFGATMNPVSVARYNLTTRWMAALFTYLFTVLIWHDVLAHQGAEEVICIGWGLLSPVVYDALKALFKWKYPEWTAHWGDNGTLKP